MATTVEIGLVRYPGSQLSAVLGIADMLTVADQVAQRRGDDDLPRLRVSERPCAPGEPPEDGGRLDVLVLPPSMEPPPTPEAAAPVATWVRERHRDGCVVASVCAGTFLLAESGLLDGRIATTHWVYFDTFRDRFPRVVLDTERLIVDDGDVVTAGGLMSWTDLGLRLIDRTLGSSVMVETAQLLLLDPPGREQRFYSTFSPRLNHGDPAILEVQHWLHATGGTEASLPALAARAGLEPRTFLRRFQKATGMTSTDYAQRLRIGRARELLQFGAKSVETIAWEVGYGDPAAFRKVFLRLVGLTPSAYRRRFRA